MVFQGISGAPFEYPPGFRQDFMVNVQSQRQLHRCAPFQNQLRIDLEAHGRGNRTSLSLRRTAEGDWRLSRYEPRDGLLIARDDAILSSTIAMPARIRIAFSHSPWRKL